MTRAAALPRSAGRTQALRIAGSVLLLAALAPFSPRQKLVEALASIPPSTIAAALPIYLSLHFLGSLKWQLMVNRPDAPLTFLEALIGGDAVTIALGVSRNRKTEQLVSGTLANRIIDLAALALLVALTISLLPTTPSHRTATVRESV